MSPAFLLAAATLAGSTAPAWPAKVQSTEAPVSPAAAFELGRRLFYDPALSRDGTIACASCHQQAAAFAHSRHRVSHGVGGALGTRNTPPLFNLAWQPAFMWDGSVAHLEFQPLSPIANPVEMGQDVAKLPERLAADPEYRAAFARAFASPDVDVPHVLRALGQFLSAMVSNGARYDRVAAGEDAFTPQEARGHAVFREHCGACHAEPLFTDFSFRGDGLDEASPDPGREKATGRPEDRGRFRVPSLRNVRLTAPYMHDGRFETLEQVLDHYDRGIAPSAALDQRLAGGIHLAASDRAALLSFLDTLTDERFVHDARFAEPRPQSKTPPRTLLDRLADLLGAPAAAHEGEEHAAAPDAPHDAPPRETPSPDLASPHLAMSAPPYELVAAFEGDALVVYLDDYATNAPIADAELTAKIGGTVLRATARGDGTYVMPAERIPRDGAQTVGFVLRTRTGETELRGTLPARGPAERAEKPSSRATAEWIALLVVAFAVALGLRRRARRR